jgi:hypothetical protein
MLTEHHLRVHRYMSFLYLTPPYLALGFLDKIKRKVSLTKISQFSSITDTDAIFSLLDKHFSLRWK